jgi:plastocyanin
MGSTRTTASLLVAVLALAGCGGGSSNDGDGAPATPRHVSIAISGFKFKPAVITVRAGARITFVNRDHADHTATGRSFDSGTLHQGDSKKVALPHAGTFAYRCDFHPFMTGEVTVVK